jgi:DNA polymerase-3 subunit beta
MKFTINSGDFLSRLQILSKTQSNKNVMPILDCLKLTLDADKITIVASDQENTLSTTLPVMEASDTGQTVCVESQLLINALREIPNQPITFIANDQTLKVYVEYQNGRFEFCGESAQEYPMPIAINEQEKKEVTLSSDVLRDGISNTRNCTANDDLRPQMNGIFFDFLADGRLVFAASDGHKLARDIHGGIGQEEAFSFILPAKTSIILQNIIGKQEEDISIKLDERGIIFTLTDYTLHARLIEGRYPNYNSVIPTDNPFTAIIDRDALINALRRVLIFSSQASGLVKLDFQTDNLLLAAQDIDFSSSAEESVACEYADQRIAIGFCGQLLLELARTLPAGNVRMALSDPSRAALITPAEQAEDSELTLLLMPMMLGN